MGIGFLAAGGPQGAIPGGAVAAFGGGLTLIGAGLQVTGGMLQLWSDRTTGQRNIAAGGFGIATGGVAAAYAQSMMRGGSNFVVRAFNSNVDSATAISGATIDGLQAIPDFIQPLEAHCGGGGN